MKIFMTGSNGFIGSHLKKRLENDGHEVYTKYSSIIVDYDICYHLSSYGNHYHQDNVLECIRVNLYILIEMLDSMKYTKIKLINFSTSSVYLQNVTFYSATKKAGELLCEAYKQEYGLDVVSIHPYSVFGPGEAEHRFIPKVINCLLTGESMELVEEPVHDWIYIDDFIDALLEGHTEIGTGVSVTNYSIVMILEMISGKKLNYKRVDSLRSYDNDNWTCPTPVKHMPLYEGLKKTYDYAKQRFEEKNS